jgi:antitoxin (DNA-binding transcriptional repressor) of toxin-antitoxin stability system
MITKLIGIKEFRQNMASLYKKAQKDNLRYIILNHNKPIFKVEPLSAKDATIEKLAYDIEKARDEVKKGKVYDFEKVCKELDL